MKKVKPETWSENFGLNLDQILRETWSEIHFDSNRHLRSYWFKYQLNNTKLNIHTWSSWPVEDSNCNKRSHLTLQKLLLQKGVPQTYDSYSLNPSLSVNFLSTTSLKLRVSVWSWMFPASILGVNNWPWPSCSFARYSIGKLFIYGSFTHH